MRRPATIVAAWRYRGGGVAPPPPPRLRPRREFWVAAVPAPTWNMAPNERDAIMGVDLEPGPDGLPDGRLPPLHARAGGTRCPTAPAGSSNQDLIPGPLLRARVGDRILVHFKNLDTLYRRPHSMHFHGVHYRPSSDGAYVPGLLGPRRRRQARPDVDLPADRGPRLGRRLALPRPLAVDGRVDRRRHVRDALDPRPHERAPDREFEVVFAPMGEFQTIDGRAFVGNTPVFTLARRPDRPVGRDGDGLRAPHLPRPRPPLGRAATAPTRHADRRPGRDLRASAGARRTPARGCTTATSRPT